MRQLCDASAVGSGPTVTADAQVSPPREVTRHADGGWDDDPEPEVDGACSLDDAPSLASGFVDVHEPLVRCKCAARGVHVAPAAGDVGSQRAA